MLVDMEGKSHLVIWDWKSAQLLSVCQLFDYDLTIISKTVRSSETFEDTKVPKVAKASCAFQRSLKIVCGFKTPLK